METKNASYGKLSLYYGLIVGGIIILLNLILYIVDVERVSYLKSIKYLILLGGIIWGTKTYRDLYLDGNISYGKSFTVGFVIGLYAAIISSIYLFLFFQYFDPGMITEFINQFEENILTTRPNISDAELEMALKYYEIFNTPIMISILTLVANVVVYNLFFLLIIAIFIKRKNVQTQI